MKPRRELAPEERKQLFINLAQKLYNNSYNEMLLDMRERLKAKPMYEPLKSRLKQDILLLETRKQEAKY